MAFRTYETATSKGRSKMINPYTILMAFCIIARFWLEYRGR